MKTYRDFFSISNIYVRNETMCHRRRIKTKEKAKVVAAAWGTESIHFFAVLAILHQDDLKKRMSCPRTI